MEATLTREPAVIEVLKVPKSYSSNDFNRPYSPNDAEEELTQKITNELRNKPRVLVRSTESRNSPMPNENKFYRFKILDSRTDLNESKLSLRSGEQKTNKTSLNEVEEEVSKEETRFITKKTAYQMINDLSHLLKSKSKQAKPNVNFNIWARENEEFEFKETVQIHNMILLARSLWFRRSWRSHKSTTKNEDYDFNYEQMEKLGFFKIHSVQVPDSCDGEFTFNILIEEFENEFISSFKQFKKFLYRGDCEVTDLNAKYLLYYAYAFENENLIDFMKKKLLASLSDQSILNALEILEVAHNYEIKELKDECIKLINISPEKVVKTAAWIKIAAKYADLVLQVFYKKYDDRKKN